MNISPSKKEITFRHIKPILLSLFACNMGLGLAHIAFDRSNAMLALSGDFEFSACLNTVAKSQIHRIVFFVKSFVKKNVSLKADKIRFFKILSVLKLTKFDFLRFCLSIIKGMLPRR